MENNGLRLVEELRENLGITQKKRFPRDNSKGKISEGSFQRTTRQGIAPENNMSKDFSEGSSTEGYVQSLDVQRFPPEDSHSEESSKE